MMKTSYADLLDRDQLKELALHKSKICLTLTMPCDMVGDEGANKNQIRFKTLMRKADHIFKKLDWDARDRKEFLKPLYSLYRNYDYWRYQSKGLIVLCDDQSFFKVFRLLFSVEENAIVDRRFYLLPVIPYLQESSSFALLLLNEQGTRIVTSDTLRSDYEVLTPPSHLASLTNFLSGYEFEKSLQYATKGNSIVPFYHGQGAAGDQARHQTYLVDYFRHLKTWVADELKRIHPTRIYYVADGKTEGLYEKQTNHSHPAMERLVQENPFSEGVDFYLSKIHDRIFEDRKAERLDIINEYHRRLKQDVQKVGMGIREIVLAAHDKRIEKLIVPAFSANKTWGRIKENEHDIELQYVDESESGVGEELVNLAAIETFLNGGKVIPLQDMDYVRAGVIPEYAALCRW